MTANAKSMLGQRLRCKRYGRLPGWAAGLAILTLGLTASAAEPGSTPTAADVADSSTVEPAPLLREVRFPKPRVRGYERFGAVGPYYPARAARAGRDGSAIIECAVAPDGALSRCILIEELPLREDFGAAALRMARVGWIVAAPKAGGEAEGDGEIGRFLVRFSGETAI